MTKNQFEIYNTLTLDNPSLVVCWQTQDIGKVGEKVINFLKEKLGVREVAEVKPEGFFALEGAVFKENLIQVTESKLWACEGNNLLLFYSDEPQYEPYTFLNTFLDLSEHHFQVKELYTVGGIPSLKAHTHPRKVMAVFNQPEFQRQLRDYYELEDITWEGPPTINSYLLWIAKKRGLPGVNLWSEVPFYLGVIGDPQAVKLTFSFLNRRFSLGLDLEELDEEVREQNKRIALLRGENAKINEYIEQLEKGLTLSNDEQVQLAKEIYNHLK